MQRRPVDDRPTWANQRRSLLMGFVFVALLIAAIAASGRLG
jgi:hypothetical protein